MMADVPTVDRAAAVITAYMASMHDGSPVRIRQRFSAAALLHLAEYVAMVHGDNNDAARLRYVHAITRMQDAGDIIAQEVADGGHPSSLAAHVYSYVVVALSPEALAAAQQ